MASTYLTRTPSSGGNRKTFTISAWFKRSKLGTTQIFFQSATDGSTRSQITLRSDDMLQFYSENGGVEKINVRTNRVLRDTNAWYNVVLAVDTTQGTASDRVKFYINGVQETSLHTATYGDQNYDTQFNHTVAHTIGRRDAYGDMYFDGLISHFHLVDGTALTASTFGSQDATTGEWKINTSPSYTVGTNGFFVLKDTNSGTDQSANTNNLTVNGTLTKTEDCPSNVFPIFTLLDPITHSYNGGTSNGGTSIQSTTNEYPYLVTNMGANKGKFYWEIKISATSSGSGDTEAMIGIVSTRANSSTQELGHKSTDYGYYAYDGKYRNNDTSTAYGNTFGLNNIIGVAMDLDNNKLYFSKDGQWQNSGVPTSGSTGTGAISITDPDSTEVGFYIPAVCVWSSGVNSTFQANFGNGYFGTTQISSEGTNASGIGKFEYDVPTGYTALSTKGLNE